MGKTNKQKVVEPAKPKPMPTMPYKPIPRFQSGCKTC